MPMKPNFPTMLTLALGVMATALSPAARGAETAEATDGGAPIGYVKNAKGEAFIARLGREQKAQAGLPVHIGSVLRTGRRGSMGVTFKDETLMSFGPDTELIIDEYLYAPAQGKLKLGSRLSKGSMNYVSGVISRLRPDAVTIKTQAGTIGTRGTQFVVRVEE